MKAQLITTNDSGVTYNSLMIWCPGCEQRSGRDLYGGLKMIPVSGDAAHHPVWTWNRDLVNVTLGPSILTRTHHADKKFVCHSFLENGIWRFLDDCTHALKGKTSQMSDLPEWVIK